MERSLYLQLGAMESERDTALATLAKIDPLLDACCALCEVDGDDHYEIMCVVGETLLQFGDDLMGNERPEFKARVERFNSKRVRLT